MPQLGHLSQATVCVCMCVRDEGPPLCPDGDINTRRFRLSTHEHQSVEGEQQVERDRRKMEHRRKGGQTDYFLINVNVKNIATKHTGYMISELRQYEINSAQKY